MSILLNKLIRLVIFPIKVKVYITFQKYIAGIYFVPNVKKIENFSILLHFVKVLTVKEMRLGFCIYLLAKAPSS